MKGRALLLVAVTGALVAVACSGSKGGAGGGTPTPTPVPTATDTLQANMLASSECRLGSADLLTSCAVALDVTLSSASIDMTNAQVGFGDSSRPLVALSNGGCGVTGCIFHGAQAAYGTSGYGLSISNLGQQLVGVFPLPHDFSLSIATPSAVNSPATLTWSPSPADGSTAYLTIVQITPGYTSFSGSIPDTGTFDVPGTAFPASGDYSVTLELFQRALIGPASTTQSVAIALSRATHTTVP